MSPTLGQLESVDLREVWQREDGDFTPWLAQKDNLNAFGAAIWLGDLELEGTEQWVGSFRADIVARDDDDRLVLIENQLNTSDHGHLGQIVAYLAGFDRPSVVCWITSRFRPEHRAAIDWLNRRTPSDFAFFAIEVELYRIGTSDPAPRFNVVSRPIDWSQNAVENLSTSELTERNRFYLRYWTTFQEHLSERQTGLGNSAPSRSYSNRFSVGRTGASLAARAGKRDNYLAVEAYFWDANAKTFFDALLTERECIEREIGEPLAWQRLDDKQAARIEIMRESVNVSNEDGWTEQHRWLADRLVRFFEVLSPRIRSVDLEASPTLEAAE